MSRQRHLGVIFGNQSYSSNQNLPAVNHDIDKMKEMLHCYDEVIVKRNIKDMRKELQEIVIKYSGEELERFHCHYSGNFRYI